jgi:hypothetical protein
MLDKYFYVVTRDNQIIELPFSERTREAVLGAMQSKGIVSLVNNSIILNGVDISKVLNEELYNDYITTVKPREYIKDGIWRDGKEHGFLRYSKWRQEKIESQKLLTTKMEEIKELPGARERISAMIKMNVEKYKIYKNNHD